MPQQSTHSSARPSPAQHSLSWGGRCDLPEPEATLHSFYRFSTPFALVPESFGSFLPGVCVPYPKIVPVSTLYSKPSCLPAACLRVRACSRACACALYCVSCDGLYCTVQ